jgi:hypothetical protein
VVVAVLGTIALRPVVLNYGIGAGIACCVALMIVAPVIWSIVTAPWRVALRCVAIIALFAGVCSVVVFLLSRFEGIRVGH